MKFKIEYILLTLSILVLGGYLILSKPNSVHYTLPSIPSIPANSIVKIEIDKGNQHTVLMKENGKWFLSPEKYPADPLKVERMTTDIAGLTLDTLVSESDDYFRYNLSDNEKVTVKVFGEKGALFSFAVGKRASTFKHTFITIQHDKKVYQAQGNFRNDFDLSSDDLRDKNVLNFSADDLLAITITKDGHALNLTRKSEKQEKTEKQPAPTKTEGTYATGWIDNAGKAIPEAEMNGLFSMISGLQCESYLDGKKKEDFKDPSIFIELQGKTKVTLSIFEKTGKKGNEYAAISSTNDYPFTLQKFKVEMIKKALQAIQPENGESPVKSK